MANPSLDAKRLCLDIEEFLEYYQAEDLIRAVAEVVNWLKEDTIKTFDGREKRLAALYDIIGRTSTELESGDSPPLEKIYEAY